MRDVLKTARDRLDWAIRFGALNMRQLSEADLEKTRDGLAAFLGIDSRGFDIHVAVLEPPYPDELSVKDLEALQVCATDLLWAAAVGDGSAGTTAVEAVRIDVVQSGKRRLLRIGGSVQAGFALTLAFLLATEEGRLVKQCRHCRSMFLRVGRQVYCTARCTDQASWRKIPEARKLKYRAKQYEKYGWRLGARKGLPPKTTGGSRADKDKE